MNSEARIAERRLLRLDLDPVTESLRRCAAALGLPPSFEAQAPLASESGASAY